MQSAVEADLEPLQLIFAIHRRMDPAIDTTEIAKEIGAASPKNSTTGAEGKARRPLSHHAPHSQRTHQSAAAVAGAIDRPPAHARLAGGPSPARTQERAARE